MTTDLQQGNREFWNKQKAQTWFSEGDWKKGLNLNAHPSVNIEEFAYQYHNNPELWEKAFKYLREANLGGIEPGKYFLDGENLFAMISESALKDPDETKWEAHRKYIDIQYVIHGKEKMGIIPLNKVSVLDSYDETKDLEFFTAPENEASYFEATPAEFFVFFPGDAHRPSLKTKDSESDKKIVIKVLAAE